MPRYMQKTKEYIGYKFTHTIVEEAMKQYLQFQKDAELISDEYIIHDGDSRWRLIDSDDFFSKIDDAHKYDLGQQHMSGCFSISSHNYSFSPIVTVTVGLETAGQIGRVFNIFESNLESAKVPEPPLLVAPKEELIVFIGHGGSLQWRELKDHLHDMHRIKVEAYEVGPRAGLSVKDVLEDMLTSSSFALLVLTGEDIDDQGELHARENVIHELGLFQGRLGFKRAIVLLERGATEFSNIYGLNQLRFSKDNIKEIFGNVLATIKREFSE